MNREEEEKSVLGKAGKLYVSSGATAPIQYEPMEVDAINQVGDGREQRKKVTFDCRNQFFWWQEE